MSNVHQNLSDSHVENMAGRDVNVTIYQNASKPFPRKQYVHEILAVRDSCQHLELVIKTHAERCYGSCFFKTMPEKELEEMYQFAMHLKQAIEKRNVPSFVGWVIQLFRK